MPKLQAPILLLVISCLGSAIDPSVAQSGETVERVQFRVGQQQPQTASGRVLVEAADGGMMLQTADGAIVTIPAEQLLEREKLPEEFRPLTAQEIGPRLLREFGERFEITETKHYVICSDAGEIYARWCGGLLERLHGGFENYWSRRDLDLQEAEFPLVAIVFARQQDFAAYAVADAGPEMTEAKGYYSLKTNRVVLYDHAASRKQPPPRSVADLNRRMAQVPFNTATVVHEATHQIAYNCGLHTRYADNPLWFTEGMAMFFETPDLRSRSGWRTIGQRNPFRYPSFAQRLRRQNSIPLRDLISSDALLLDAEQAEDAYAASWALTYFLLKTKSKEYATYLQGLAAKRPLRYGTAEERLAEFQAAFGDDLTSLEQDWLRFMARAK